ncbi:MAG: response regulator [Planctomycetaceae bacterium]
MPPAQQSTDVFFNQPCPVCGRQLHIRVQLLGRRVYCQHCGGGFTAVGESLGGPPARDRVDELLARAAEALERAACGDADDSALTG